MNPSRTNRVILMADDDVDDRLLVREALAEAAVPHHLLFAEDGQMLLDYLKGTGSYANQPDAPRPELILLDLNMPLKDGREVLREIRSDAVLRRIPVVVFTTSRADTDIHQMYELGANSFVTKPAAFADLVRLMKRLTEYWFDTVHLPEPVGHKA
ncbi:MAG: response regulator [Verrucomicrobia bacterium]|jgi:CheY-like chemotaxis protein|nr:response regulator [Verrucomicrobiota bacterium]